jgi:phage tail-like protein
MRGLIPGLVSPHPLGLSLPALYQEDEFTQRFMAALDDVLAPVPMTIDNFSAYLDPLITPVDFLPWLAGWVGLELDENWSEEQQRRLVAEAAVLYQWRGTRRGLVELIHHYLGVEEAAIEVTDSGGAVWSVAPGTPPPGSAQPALVVRVRVADPGSIDRARLERLVATAKPAHVAHEVEVVAA